MVENIILFMKYKHSTVGFLRKFLPLGPWQGKMMVCAVCQTSSHPDTVCIATQLDRAPDGLWWLALLPNIYSAYNLRLLFDRIGGNAWRCMLRFNGVDSFETFFCSFMNTLRAFPLDISTRRLKFEVFAKVFMIIAVRVPLSLGSVNNILAGYGSIKGIPMSRILTPAKWMGFTYFGPHVARNTRGGGTGWCPTNFSLLWGCKPWPGRTLLQILRYGEQSWWLPEWKHWEWVIYEDHLKPLCLVHCIFERLEVWH